MEYGMNAAAGQERLCCQSELGPRRRVSHQPKEDQIGKFLSNRLHQEQGAARFECHDSLFL